MEPLVSVVMVVAIVAFIVMKQINKVTSRLDSAKEERSFNRYAQFSSVVQEYVRSIKQSLDSSREMEHRDFRLLEGKNEAMALEILSDCIRKLVFFETLMAKQKSDKEIEEALFTILNNLENFLKEYCEEGELLAEELREDLFEAYENL